MHGRIDGLYVCLTVCYCLASKEWKKNVYAFQDLRSVPDEIREYSSSLINDRTPILIDNGTIIDRLYDLLNL